MSDVPLKPPLTLAQIAERVPDATLVGDGSVMVQTFSHPRMMQSDQDMVFILDAKAFGLFENSPRQPVAAVVAEDVDVPDGLFQGYLRVKRPRFALVSLLDLFDRPRRFAPGVHPSAVVEASAEIDPSASIGAFVYVGEQAKIGPDVILMPHVSVEAGAQLGEGCVLHPGVRIGEQVVLGRRVEIHHNASIGADGFSYVTPEPGSIEAARSGGQVSGQNTHLLKIKSIGTVMIEDDVEIGACATIDRSNLGATVIRRGTKIDNLVMVGHNNTVGQNCLIVSQTGIAGSCTIGDRVVIAGQVGIGDHLTIGDDAILMAKSGVMRDVQPKEVVVGIPALPRRETLQNVMYVGKLKELFQEVRQLKKRVAELEGQNEKDEVHA